eukprot:537424_1
MTFNYHHFIIILIFYIIFLVFLYLYIFCVTYTHFRIFNQIIIINHSNSSRSSKKNIKGHGKSPTTTSTSPSKLKGRKNKNKKDKKIRNINTNSSSKLKCENKNKSENSTPLVQKKEDAIIRTAVQYEYCNSTVRKYIDQFEHDYEIAKSLQGLHPKTIEALNTIELQVQFKGYIKEKILSKKRFTADNITQWVNTVLLKDKVENRGNPYNEKTVLIWMRQFGYIYGKYKKSVYIDGHERDDVVKARNIYVKEMIDLRNDMFILNDENDKKGIEWIFERRKRNILTIILVVHDESVVHLREGHKYGWYHKHIKPILPKSEGKGFNISDFVIELDGPLQCDSQYARVIHKIGKGSDEFYWSNKHMMKQIKTAIDIFEKKFKIITEEDRKYIKALFQFDNAGCHTKTADDALNVNHMNVNPGGKQHKLRNGWYIDSHGVEQIHKMVDDDGIAKGMKQILIERGINVIGLKKDDLKRLLKKQPDFIDAAKHTILSDYIKARGHLSKYGIKYHPELAGSIENYWMFAKKDFRDNQMYNLTHKNCIQKIKECLNNVSITSLQRSFRKTRRFEDAYDGGAVATDVMEKVKILKIQHRSHRRA